MGRIVFENNDGQGLLTMEEDISVGDAFLLRKALEDSLHNCSRLIIRLDDLASADLSTLQLLVSARKSFQKAGLEIRADGDIPPVFKALVNDAGYSHQMKWFE